MWFIEPILICSIDPKCYVRDCVVRIVDFEQVDVGWNLDQVYMNIFEVTLDEYGKYQIPQYDITSTISGL